MKNLTLSYIAALSVIALVIIASQVLVQRSIATSIYDARTINISGRQSMLSQLIAKAVLAMDRAESKEEYVKRQAELDEATREWERAHNALQYGDELMELDNVTNSEETLLYFLELEPKYVKIRAAIEKLINIDFEDANRDELVAEQTDIILKNEGDFLELMNEITLDYDREATQRISSLSRTEYILLAIALLLLLAEALYIFRPVINRINEYTQKLLRQEKSLKKALFLQKEEKAKVEYLNKQAESVFQTVQQGLFLLNEKFVISELYSTATEGIIDEAKLGGSNFLQVMQTKLVKRDQDALEMFVKHLFNPDIQEDILSQLNPLEQVQIFTNKSGGSIDSKHISVSFSRIRDAKKIFAVLVTITDETEAVIMQQKINETEQKNKKESEQLLSILRVDPLALKDFLDSTQASLKEISDRYESDKGKTDPKDLIRYTFNIIHNLKGNAGLIDLELIANKLHEIEDIITDLRHKEDLVGNDFLKILYEINELSTTIINMQRMLVRIADVNKKIAKGEMQTTSNQSLSASLDKGLKKLSDEIGKPAELEFNDNGITIPERYKVSLKDVAIQLFRNSLVHGIEDPAERREKGKPETARIGLEIQKSDEEIIITYQDDGQGLDENKIRQKAINESIMSEEEAAKLDQKGIAEIIFNDGLSTAKQIDHHAGRGQGMSLIRDLIKKHDGRYELSYQTGKHFKLDFALPLEKEPSLTEA
jgi:two-component sensor histidine kinase